MERVRDLDALDDAELVRRHAAGDADAFGVVVARHQDRLWALALRTLGDREEAADALQDALVSALRASAGGGFRGESAVTTWLHRIVVNACLDRVRRRRARPTVPLPEEADVDDERPVRAVAVVEDPAGASTTALVVQRALRELPVEQAAALVLVDVQGYSVADAAQVLGVAPGTVKSRCSRGRARLLPLLAGLRGGAPGARGAGGAGPAAQADQAGRADQTVRTDRAGRVGRNPAPGTAVTPGGPVGRRAAGPPAVAVEPEGDGLDGDGLDGTEEVQR